MWMACFWNNLHRVRSKSDEWRIEEVKHLIVPSYYNIEFCNWLKKNLSVASISHLIRLLHHDTNICAQWILPLKRKPVVLLLILYRLIEHQSCMKLYFQIPIFCLLEFNSSFRTVRSNTNYLFAIFYNITNIIW